MKTEDYSEEYYKRNRFEFLSSVRGGYADYERYRDRKYWEWRIEKVLEHKSRGRVLDVGCAYGFFLQHLPESFERYGVDVSQHAIDFAKKDAPGIRFKLFDISTGIPFQGVKFDAITMFDVLEHVLDLNCTLKNLQKMLKPDGLVFVMVPVASKMHHLTSAFGIGLLNNDVSHINLSTTKTWLMILNQYFKVRDHFKHSFGKRYLWPFHFYHFFVLGKK